MLWRIYLAAGSHGQVALTRQSSLEVRFGDHLVDFMVALSAGGCSRTLVDFLVDFTVDFLVDLSVRVSVEQLSPSFLKIRCSVDDFIISIVDCHRGSVAV